MEMEFLNSLQRKVSLLRSEGKYKETMEAAYELLEHGVRLDDAKSILVAHLNNAASYYSIGAIEEAFVSIEAYEEVCVVSGDKSDYMNLYNVHFLLYEITKNMEKAKVTLDKSIKLALELKYYNIASNGYSNYSSILAEEENFQQALDMARIGLEMAKLHEPKSPILEFRVRLNIANSYIGLGNFGLSKSMIDEMMNDPLLDSFIREKTQSLDLQGRWYIKQKLYKEAFESWTEAKNLAASYNDVKLMKVLQESRCEACDLMGDTQLGYAVQKEYIALLNEISNREIAMAALKLDLKHNILSIEKKANTDYLTGLYNRSYMETTVDDWLYQSVLTKESIICIALDMDNLKSINDEYGHLIGDEVIKLISETCLSKIRENDLMGRFGGDEFLIFLKGISFEQGKKKVEQIAQAVRDIDIVQDGKVIPVSASIGVANNMKSNSTTFKELFDAADRALYKAKKNGKNQICYS